MAISTVSFTKTPQAGDDAYSYDEDNLLSSGTYDNAGNVLTLDVMSNDLGGAAKKLYSIDNGDFLNDLLTNNVNTGWEATANGNLIRIVDGKIKFDITNAINALGGTDLNSLTANDHIHDTFTYAIQLGNGTLSTATVTVDIQGQNDAASFAPGGDSGTAIEDGANASGVLVVNDVDHGEAQTQAASGSGDNGLGSFTVDADGNWIYSADHAENDHLAAGATATDSFTVDSEDGTAQQTVNVTIVGTNDAASFAPGGNSGTAVEDGANASGALVVNDVDDGEAHTQAASGSTALGSFSVDGDGNWTYAADHAANDHLAAGATATDSFTVDSEDGTAQQTVNVTIVGTNDAASISGDTSGAVTEDGTLSASGTLAVSDADDGEAHAQAAGGSTALGGYSVDADGNWSYTVDNAAIQHLAAGQHASDSFTVDSSDGTAHQTVAIDIVGTNDAASISGDLSGSVTEDGTTTTGGTVVVSDVDDGQAHAQAAAFHGTFGDFTFDSSSGAWTYTLRNDDANVQALNTDETRTDTMIIASLDTTAITSVVVTINGADDAPPQVVASLPPVFTGGGDPNDFDSLGLAGSQTIIGANQTQTLYGGADNDTLNGGNSVDTLYGGSGDDTLNGNNAGDMLYGGSGKDTLNGGTGPDTLVGGYGADTITGGQAADTIGYIALKDTGDTIIGFESGADKLDLAALDANTGTLAIDDVFAWGGQQTGQFVLANSVTWFQNGNDVVVLADTDGNLATAEFSITLANVTNLLMSDFTL